MRFVPLLAVRSAPARHSRAEGPGRGASCGSATYSPCPVRGRAGVAIFDRVTSPAGGGDDHAAHVKSRSRVPIHRPVGTPGVLTRRAYQADRCGGRSSCEVHTAGPSTSHRMRRSGERDVLGGRCRLRPDNDERTACTAAPWGNPVQAVRVLSLPWNLSALHLGYGDPRVRPSEGIIMGPRGSANSWLPQ